MAEYVSEGLESSATDILRGMLDEYQAKMPGWVPNPGDPLVIAFGIVAQRQAVLQDIYSQVKALIFTYFGTSIANVPFRSATPATVDATLTVNAEYLTEEHELPAGFRVSLEGPEGEPVTFATVQPVKLDEDEEAATVTLVAQEPGTEGNELTGAVAFLDTRNWIQSLTLLSETAGGEDEEEEAQYRNRLVAKERRDSPTIITAVDAQEAILEIPGVGRCLILDNYVPKKGSEPAKENVEGAFTAVISDENGDDVSGTIKEEALDLVNSERLLDLQGYVIDPTRTNVAVAYTFDVFPGWDVEAVKAAADAAVEEYFSNATWGLLPGSAGSRDWEDELTVRYSEIYFALNTVQGLNHALSVKINGVADKNATLAGPGALPTLTSVTGTLA